MLQPSEADFKENGKIVCLQLGILMDRFDFFFFFFLQNFYPEGKKTTLDFSLEQRNKEMLVEHLVYM